MDIGILIVQQCTAMMHKYEKQCKRAVLKDRRSISQVRLGLINMEARRREVLSMECYRKLGVGILT